MFNKSKQNRLNLKLRCSKTFGEWWKKTKIIEYEMKLKRFYYFIFCFGNQMKPKYCLLKKLTINGICWNILKRSYKLVKSDWQKVYYSSNHFLREIIVSYFMSNVLVPFWFLKPAFISNLKKCHDIIQKFLRKYHFFVLTRHFFNAYVSEHSKYYFFL